MPDGSDIPEPDSSRPPPSIHVVEYRRPAAAAADSSLDLDELVSDEPSGMTSALRLFVAVILLIAVGLVLWLVFAGLSPR